MNAVTITGASGLPEFVVKFLDSKSIVIEFADSLPTFMLEDISHDVIEAVHKHFKKGKR